MRACVRRLRQRLRSADILFIFADIRLHCGHAAAIHRTGRLRRYYRHRAYSPWLRAYRTSKTAKFDPHRIHTRRPITNKFVASD